MVQLLISMSQSKKLKEKMKARSEQIRGQSGPNMMESYSTKGVEQGNEKGKTPAKIIARVLLPRQDSSSLGKE